jgi:hypothetical protein
MFGLARRFYLDVRRRRAARRGSDSESFCRNSEAAAGGGVWRKTYWQNTVSAECWRTLVTTRFHLSLVGSTAFVDRWFRLPPPGAAPASVAEGATAGSCAGFRRRGRHGRGPCQPSPLGATLEGRVEHGRRELNSTPTPSRSTTPAVFHDDGLRPARERGTPMS